MIYGLSRRDNDILEARMSVLREAQVRRRVADQVWRTACAATASEAKNWHRDWPFAHRLFHGKTLDYLLDSAERFERRLQHARTPAARAAYRKMLEVVQNDLDRARWIKTTYRRMP